MAGHAISGAGHSACSWEWTHTDNFLVLKLKWQSIIFPHSRFLPQILGCLVSQSVSQSVGQSVSQLLCQMVHSTGRHTESVTSATVINSKAETVFQSISEAVRQLLLHSDATDKVLTQLYS